MIKKIFLIFLLIQFFAAHVIAETKELVSYPSPEIIGKNINNPILIINKKKVLSNNVINQIILDINKDGKVVGVVTIFSQNIRIEDIENSINAKFVKYRVKGFGARSKVKIWKIPKKFVIQLSHTDDGNAQLIYISLEKGSLQQSSVPSAQPKPSATK